MTLEGDKSPHWREVCVLAPYDPKNDAILEDCTQQLLGLGMQTSSTSDEYVLMSLSPSSSTFQQCMTRRPTRRNANSNYFKHFELAMPNVHCAATTKSPPSSCLQTAMPIYLSTSSKPTGAMALEFTALFNRHPWCFWLWFIYNHLHYEGHSYKGSTQSSSHQFFLNFVGIKSSCPRTKWPSIQPHIQKF